AQERRRQVPDHRSRRHLDRYHGSVSEGCVDCPSPTIVGEGAAAIAAAGGGVRRRARRPFHPHPPRTLTASLPPLPPLAGEGLTTDSRPRRSCAGDRRSAPVLHRGASASPPSLRR